MRDIMGMMKQAKELQGRMEQVQAEIAALRVEGYSGGGLVAVTLGGKGDLVSLKIDPSLVKPDEGEILEDLIVAAHADARTKLESASQQKMQALTGGLNIPGLKLPF
jgi:DNA-binding YbaB/EbfC family protein